MIIINKKQALYRLLYVDIDEYTGDLFIAINQSLEDIHIIITCCGMTIEEDTISAMRGQSIMYNMNTYEDGVYDLTVEGEGHIVSKYRITIYEE